VSVGTEVSALAVKVLDKFMVMAAAPNAYAQLVVRGRVTGRGDGNKWKVQWEFCGQKIDSQHGAKSFDSAVPVAGVPIPANVGAPDTDSEDSDSVNSEHMSISDEDGIDVDDSEILAPSLEQQAEPGQNLLNCHGLQWIEEKEGVSDDYRLMRGVQNVKAKLMWPANIRNDHLFPHTPLDYFLLFFPDRIESICTWTSAEMPGAALTPHELLKFFGLLLYMCIEPRRNRRAYWNTTSETIETALNYGKRFGMARNRWEEIWRCLTLHGATDTTNPWFPVYDFVEAMNERIIEVYYPSSTFCVDESSSKWRGMGDWYDRGMPHITKCPRKPETLSCEFKDNADATTGIIVRLEICEGKERMKQKEWAGVEGISAGAAMCMRLCKPWFGTGRMLVADSYFASVNTLVNLKKHGIYFTGLVKTAYTGYPKAWCKAVAMGERGDTKTATAVKDGVEMIAHVWNDPGKVGKPRKALISACGTTIEAPAVERPRKRKNPDTGLWEDWTRKVKRTALVKHYFDHAGVIDHANRLRMDGGRMERTVETKKWDRRVFSSFLSVVICNAYMGYSMDNEKPEQHEFNVWLARELIFNKKRGAEQENVADAAGMRTYPKSTTSTPSPPKEKGPSDAVPLVDHDQAGPLLHDIQPLRRRPEFKNRRNAKLNCKHCHRDGATLYCASCDFKGRGDLFALCAPGTGSNCLSWHCQHGV